VAQTATSYSLGPISAGADSPLGQLFGFAAGLSANYATGLAAAVNDPAGVQQIQSGQALTPAQTDTLVSASQAPIGSGGVFGTAGNPVTQLGTALGTLLGSGVNIIGSTLGLAGKTATPGVVSGVGSAASGASQVTVGGVTSGITGVVSGGLSGVAAALAGGAGTGSSFLVIGGALLLALLFLYLI
jgi:hypothetical protein